MSTPTNPAEPDRYDRMTVAERRKFIAEAEKLADDYLALNRAYADLLEGAQAKPVDPGTVWLKHDDDLRYVSRVLESEATPEDRVAARKIIHALRTMVRSYATARSDETK